MKIRYELDSDPANYLNLFKWITDDSARVKDKMWTMATWLFTLLGALLGFITKHSHGEKGIIAFTDPTLVSWTTVIAMTLSGYSIFLFYQYGLHIREGWNRADYIKNRIEGLNELWFTGNAERIQKEIERDGRRETLPPIAFWLIIMALFYLSIFFIIFVFSLVV
jgi:hypothetical protein